MWVIFAFLSALFAGVTSILAKCGIKKTGSNTATALRTIVVLLFAWIMVLIVQSQNSISQISKKSWLFLILSGLSTGISWLCFYKALQIGDVNKVVPIDKSSIILTLFLSFFILQETITLIKSVGIVLLSIGTFLMINKKEINQLNSFIKPDKSWIVFALFSAIFASLTAVFGKLGITNVESNLGTALRTIVVLLFAWIMVFISGEHKQLLLTEKKELIFILISGVTTGLSWLFYYKALHDGLTSTVVAIDKCSIVITILFSSIFLKENIKIKQWIGLLFIIFGTFAMIY